jgi:hypothetical protein
MPNTKTNRTALFNRKQPGGVFTVQDMLDHPGDIWFVDSTASAASDTAGFGKNPDAPVATIDYAVGLATASKGDVIYVMPGHNETITAATSLVIDKIGLSIIGLGRGMNRPILDFDNTAGSIEMDAASCRLSNIVLRASVASCVVAINVDASDCEIDNCHFTFESTGDEFITCIDLDGFDRCHIHDCTFDTEEAAGASTEAIRIDETDDSIIENNIFRGTWSNAAIINEGALCPRLLILNNIIYNSDTSVYNAIDFGSLSSTGIVAGNTITALYATTLSKLIRTGDMTWHENTFANAVSEGASGLSSGVPIPATTSV